MNTDVRRRRYISIFVAACAIAAIAVTAPSASAATASVKGKSLVYKATRGETNFVTINQGRLVDLNASISVPLDGVSLIRVDVRDGDDVVQLQSTSIPTHIKGGLGNDVLAGGAGEDDILGLSGDDTLFGNQGRDRLLSGTGDDRVYAVDLGVDHVNCGIGNDAAGLDTYETTNGLLADRAHRCERDMSSATADAEAKSVVVTAAEAMETCATDNNGHYSPTSCTKSDLLAIEPTLADAGARLTVTASTPVNGYTITVTSDRSGSPAFTLTRNSNGSTSRTCYPAGDGGCPSNGIW